MGTKNFNLLDKLIARLRLSRVLPYVQKNSVILDFGCGHQAYLLTHIQNIIMQGIGVDYDAVTRKVGVNIETKNFQFKRELPFMDEMFDTIFSIAVIEHINPQDVAILLREFKRVLKPGGKVIITTPTPFGKLILEFLAFRLGAISKDEVGDHKKYYSRQDLANLAKKSGFQFEKYSTFQFGGNSLCVLSK